MPPIPAAAETTLDAQLLDLMLRVGSRWVLWLLLGLSLIAVSVMLERIWFFIQARRQGPRIDEALRIMRSQGPQAALGQVQGISSMQAAVVRACLTYVGDGAASVEEHVAATIEQERLRYERGLAFLGTLGSNAPFIGLFGTVLGIIRAFHDLAANTTQGAAAVMAGIAEALVATAVGLLVALPAVATYNFFARHVEASAASAQGIGHAILAWVKAAPKTSTETAGRASSPTDGEGPGTKPANSANKGA